MVLLERPIRERIIVLQDKLAVIGSEDFVESIGDIREIFDLQQQLIEDLQDRIAKLEVKTEIMQNRFQTLY